jgi:hypothetical protein
VIRAAAFVGLLGLALTAAGGASGSSRPALHVSLHPLTVTGADFRAGEKVTVVATVPPRFLTRRTVASSDGSFVVRFESVTDIPRGLRVRATGSEGDAAMYSPRAPRISPPTT